MISQRSSGSNKIRFLIIFLNFIYFIIAEEIDESPEDLFLRGIEYHNDNNWLECIKDLEAAISKYRQIIAAIADCRIRCTNQDFEYMNPQNIDDLYFYEKMIKKTLCFMKCKRLNYPELKFKISSDKKVLKDLSELVPYLYIQSCYYEEKQNQNAASAAFTYLAQNPDDFLSKANFKYFSKLPDVNLKEITNFEVEEYYPLYLNAVNSYNRKDWEHTIAYMEEAIHAYLAADEKCRVLCEGSFDQGWLPDFTTSVSNHFTFCLQCKQLCSHKLKTLDGMKGEELLADFYNYLHFAYYKLKKFADAARCVASFLLIHPFDEEMIRNKNLYRDRVDDMLFEPRSEIVYYLARSVYEKKLLKFIEDEFTVEMKEVKLAKNVNSEENQENLNSEISIVKNTAGDDNKINKNKQSSKKAFKNDYKSVSLNRNPFKKYIKKK